MINFVLTVGAWAVKAFVASIMFNWFVSPTFNIEEIGFVPMLGILFLISLLFKLRLKDALDKVEKDFGREATKKERGHATIALIILMFTILGLSYLINLFM